METNNQLIKILSGERFTPYSLARKLKAKVILESATFDGGRARYSLLLVREAFRIIQESGKVCRVCNGERIHLKLDANRDILNVLSDMANQHHAVYQDFPFPAGGIGFLSYEFAQYFDTITLSAQKEDISVPEAMFLFGHVLIVFDHYSDLLYLIGLNYEECSIDLEAALRDVEQSIYNLDFNYLSPPENSTYTTSVLGSTTADKALFESNVEKIRKEIYAGNLLQAVLSRRLCLQTDMPAIETYRRLRSTNPAPYLVYLDFDDFQIFAASPEVHVRVKNKAVLMRPLAGTRRRDSDAVKDAALEKELLADPKERAEHLMLVDLVRNDMGRVCVPGSIQVSDYQSIERYSQVMHIVSQVEGKLQDNEAGIDVLRATFPAGTVSGAPKIRAIETLSSLETVRRGFYAGVVMFVEPGGDLNSCITIRAGLRTGNKTILHAGAGVVFDSMPEREYEETQEKLRALIRACSLQVEM